MRKATTALVAIVAFGLAALARAEAPPDFAWRLSLVTQGEHAYYEVRLPEGVYKGAVRGDLGDLRVFNGEGSPVPYAFVPLPAPAREQGQVVGLALYPLFVDDAARTLGDLSVTLRRDAAGTRVDLTSRDGSPVSPKRLAGYLIDAGEREAPFATLILRLANASDVDVRVRIDGSDDLVAWRPLSSNAPLLSLDYRGQRMLRDRIALNGGRARYMRLAFTPSTSVPEIAGVQGEFAERIVDAPRQWREAGGNADHAHPGDYVFDIGGSFPVDRVTLVLPDANTVAPAQVYAAQINAQDRVGTQDAFFFVGSTVFYRVREEGNETVNSPLAIALAARRRFKVHVDPQTGALGDKPPTLSVGWRPRSIVFVARGSGPFTLAYGSAQATPVALPITTLVPGFDSRTRPATFGVAAPGEALAPPALQALRTPIDVKRWLLWATLALATFVLAWMAMRILRQTSAAPPSRAAKTDTSATGVDRNA